MTRQTTRALALLCLSAILAACGGGQDPASSTATERTATTAVTEETTPPASRASATPPVSAATSQAWAESASLNRAEVQQEPVEGDANASAVRISPKAITAPSAPLYRFYNIQTGAHLFTRDLTERDRTLNTLPQFRYEGAVFSAWSSTDTGLSPVYRFYNVSTGTHFFTISEAEKNSIVATQPNFQLEGPAYYASKTALTGTIPLFRFYNLQRGFHFYTASAAERDSIIANLGAVYQYEGIGYYVKSSIGNYNRALASFAGRANSPGYVNAQGESARFGNLAGMNFDSSGNLYLVDRYFNWYGGDATVPSEIRVVSPSGVVSSFAGNIQNSGYKDGVGSEAQFGALTSMTIDSTGVMHIGDYRTVRQVSPHGLVTTIAGSMTEAGNANGQPQSARFNRIRGIVKDSFGNLYVSEYHNHAIRKISPTGVVSTFAGGASAAASGFVDGQGTTARFNSPGQLAIDASDHLYVTDQFNHRVRKISPSGLVTTLAGQAARGCADGSGMSAKFDNPYAITVHRPTGDVYMSDLNSYTVRRITPTGDVTTVLGTCYNAGVFFGALPAGLSSVNALAIRGDRLYISSLSGIYWTNLPP